MKIQLIKYIDKVFGVLLTRLLTTPLSQPINNPKNILVIRPGGIGDAVLLIPSLHRLKSTYPEATITVLAEKRNSGVFSLSPAVDRLLLYDRPSGLLQAIRGRYDVVIDSEQWHRLSAVAARLTRAPVIIGYGSNERARLLTHSISYSNDNYEVDSFLTLLAPLGIGRSIEIGIPFLTIPEATKLRVKEFLSPLVENSFVAIFPGASIPERRWGWEKFSEVAEKLHLKGMRIVIVGGKEDAADGERIIAGKVGINLAGKTSLAETGAVINESAVLISGDSGILHVGVGLDRPTVSLFGPGIAKKWAPHGPRHIVISKNLPCSPCTMFGNTPKCPLGALCMGEINVDEVVAAVSKLLRLGKAIDNPKLSSAIIPR